MLRPSVFASPKVCSDLLTCVTTSVAPCKPEGLAAAPRTKVQLLRGEGTRNRYSPLGMLSRLSLVLLPVPVCESAK
eukprot:s3460_g4.t1